MSTETETNINSQSAAGATSPKAPSKSDVNDPKLFQSVDDDDDVEPTTMPMDSASKILAKAADDEIKETKKSVDAVKDKIEANATEIVVEEKKVKEDTVKAKKAVVELEEELKKVDEMKKSVAVAKAKVATVTEALAKKKDEAGTLKAELKSETDTLAAAAKKKDEIVKSAAPKPVVKPVATKPVVPPAPKPVVPKPMMSTPKLAPVEVIASPDDMNRSVFSTSVEYMDACIGMVTKDGEDLMAVCQKPPGGTCPTEFDTSRCQILQAVGVNVMNNATLMKF